MEWTQHFITRQREPRERATPVAHLEVAELMAAAVGVEVEALPLYPDVLAFAGSEEAALELVLYGGEEFEAVLVVPQEGAAAVEARAKAKGLPLFRAGRVVSGEGVYLRGAPLPRKGYAHF